MQPDKFSQLVDAYSHAVIEHWRGRMPPSKVEEAANAMRSYVASLIRPEANRCSKCGEPFPHTLSQCIASSITETATPFGEALDVLRELVGLIKAHREGEYEFDSFTTQPAEALLRRFAPVTEAEVTPVIQSATKATDGN